MESEQLYMCPKCKTKYEYYNQALRCCNLEARVEQVFACTLCENFFFKKHAYCCGRKTTPEFLFFCPVCARRHASMMKAMVCCQEKPIEYNL